MERVLDRSLEVRYRLDILFDNPKIVSEAVLTMLSGNPDTVDPHDTLLVQHLVAYIPTSARTSLHIYNFFKDTCPNIAHRALIFNLRSIINEPAYVEPYIRAYFETDLPLDHLKATLVTGISDGARTIFGGVVDILYVLERLRLKEPERLGNEAKSRELILIMAKAMLDLYAAVGCTSLGRLSLAKCFVLCRDNPEMLNTFVSYVPHPGSLYTPDIVWTLKLEICTDHNRDNLLLTYLLLDDILREHETRQRLDARLRLEARPTAETPLKRFVNDQQNVHRVRIESDVLVELDTLDAKYKEREDSMEQLREKPELREPLERIDTDSSDFHGRTLKQWLRIVFLWAKDEGHLPILEQELKDMTGMCSSGHFRRLINVMNGFLFNLEESNNEKLRMNFFSRTNALIQAQPDADEILSDLPGKGREFVNKIATEMMVGERGWSDVMRARRLYLYGDE